MANAWPWQDKYTGHSDIRKHLNEGDLKYQQRFLLAVPVGSEILVSYPSTNEVTKKVTIKQAREYEFTTIPSNDVFAYVTHCNNQFPSVLKEENLKCSSGKYKRSRQEKV